MELLQLQYFVKVAQLGSITRAAEQLHISQPALSATIARLENDIGITLFERTPNRILLSEPGEVFLRHLEAALAGLEAGIEAGKQAQKTDKTDIVVATAFGVTQNAVQRFQAEDPSANITIKLADNEVIEEAVLTGAADFGLCLGESNHAKLVSNLLMEGRCFAAVSRSHPKYAGDTVRLAQLVGERIFCSRLAKTNELAEQLFQEKSLSCNVIPLDEKDVLFEAVNQQLGIAMCMPMLYDEQNNENRLSLRFVLIEDAQATWKVGIIHKKDKYLTPRVQALMKAVTAHFNQNHRMLGEYTREILARGAMGGQE